MKDKQLEELQNVLKSALKLREEMNNCMCSIVLNRDTGNLIEMEQFRHLSKARYYLDTSIQLIEGEIESEMVKSGRM
jgi:hypothetical protein